jgi:hypothetical protein
MAQDRKRTGAVWIVIKTIVAYVVRPALGRALSLYEFLAKHNTVLAAGMLGVAACCLFAMWWPHRHEPSVEWDGPVSPPQQVATPMDAKLVGRPLTFSTPSGIVVAVPSIVVWTATTERPELGCSALPKRLKPPYSKAHVEVSFAETQGKCVATTPYTGPSEDTSFWTHMSYLSSRFINEPWALFEANVLGVSWKVASVLALVIPFVAMLPILAVYGAFFVLAAIFRGLKVVAGWPFAPRAADEITDPPPTDARLVLCQLSDLHLTAGDKQPFEIEAGEAIPANGVKMDTTELSRRTVALLDAACRLNPSLLALTGDITDGGTDGEWGEFEAAVTQASPTCPLLVLPGNHDLCINPDEPDLDLQALPKRKRRFLEHLKHLERGTWAPLLTKATKLEQSFPRKTTLPAGIRIFGLDSNGYASRNALSNAVGIIGDSQRRELRRELRSGSGPVVVLCHHHVARPFDSGIKDPFLIALDAKALLRDLCSYNQRDPSNNSVLVLHGHRHVNKFSLYSHSGGCVFIYGHPSSTMGNAKGKDLDGIPRFTSIWLDSRNRWFVKLHPLNTQS